MLGRGRWEGRGHVALVVGVTGSVDEPGGYGAAGGVVGDIGAAGQGQRFAVAEVAEGGRAAGVDDDRVGGRDGRAVLAKPKMLTARALPVAQTLELGLL